MNMITDKAIRAAIASMHPPKAGRAELRDPGERGGGRLTLVIRSTDTRVIAEWYAAWHRGRRRTTKMGNYPSKSLAQARKEFREDYLPVILKGEDPVGPRGSRARGDGTVKELFEAYLDYLGDTEHAVEVRRKLLGPKGAVKAIGENRRAADVRKAHIIPFLAEIHDRGAPTQANYTRAVMHAAFAYGIRSANSFFDHGGAIDWQLEFNPVSVIPQNPDASRARDRALSEGEVRAFWRWLEVHRGSNPAMDALRLLIATGQRPREILQLSVGHREPAQGLLNWKKTKNGRPHSLPLPRQATAILDGLTPNHHDLYFPSWKERSRHAHTYVVERLVRRYIDETGAAPFEPRDLRRTWKTLAGAAGVSKEVRDRLQNHALADVSSRHYDKWSYLPEKRAGMEAWASYLDQILAGDDTASAEWMAQSDVAVRRLKTIMGSRSWRAAPQARHEPNWIGIAVAEAFELKRTRDWMTTMQRLVPALVHHRVVLRRMEPDAKGRMVPILVFSPEIAAALDLHQAA